MHELNGFPIPLSGWPAITPSTFSISCRRCWTVAQFSCQNAWTCPGTRQSVSQPVDLTFVFKSTSDLAKFMHHTHEDIPLFIAQGGCQTPLHV